MTVGTGADTARNLPPVTYTPNPGLFDQLTQRNHYRINPFSMPGDNQTNTTLIPPSGVLSWITVTFDGSLVVTLPTGTATTAWMWPYGLVNKFSFTANVLNDLQVLTGVDAHVLRFLMNPAYIDAQDTFPGTVGGGNALSAATTPVHLTWHIPLVMDKTTLVGAIYAQSQQNSLTLQTTQMPVSSTTAGSALITLTGTATATLTGTFNISLDTWDVPIQPEQGVVTPDLSRLHGINFYDQALTNTGDTPVFLTKTAGQLMRLLVQVRNGANSVLNPKASAVSGFSQVRLAYGGNKEPQVWPVADLAARNNEHYGGLLPYSYVALDFARENPVRDAVMLQGVTDLRSIINIATGTTINANSVIHVVQETLFAAA